jgi:hypothetical protein
MCEGASSLQKWESKSSELNKVKFLSEFNVEMYFFFNKLEQVLAKKINAQMPEFSNFLWKSKLRYTGLLNKLTKWISKTSAQV